MKSYCPKMNYKNTTFNISYIKKDCTLYYYMSQICDFNHDTNMIQLIYDAFNDISFYPKLDDLLLNVNESINFKDLKNNSYKITTLEYLKNNNIMDFGKCEVLLKNHYHIDMNESLLMVIIDKKPGSEKSLITQIEYAPFHPEKKTPLDLSLCKDVKVILYYDVKGEIDTDNLYKYDQKSDYYNDLCYPNNTENGVDMTMNERRKKFANKEMNLCEGNCDFDNFDIQKNKS